MGNKRILVVEDEEDLLIRYSEYAKTIFPYVFMARDKQSAKSILKREKIHCIVTDNKLPDGTGLSFVQEAKATEKKIPVILITGYADKETAIESVNSHLFYFLEKPFLKDIFINVLEECNLFLEKQERVNQIVGLYNIRDSTFDILKEKYQISKREMEIISRAVHAESNSLIADKLFISTGTVKKHLYNIFEKMNISSKTELRNIIFDINGLDSDFSQPFNI